VKREQEYEDDDGELTEEAKKRLAIARKTPRSRYISLEELKRHLKIK
jgi:hypothetical protein